MYIKHAKAMGARKSDVLISISISLYNQLLRYLKQNNPVSNVDTRCKVSSLIQSDGSGRLITAFCSGLDRELSSPIRKSQMLALNMVYSTTT
mgnify:CR=1 FL=1